MEIICYRRGCNRPAEWTIPGHPPVHVCTKCLRHMVGEDLNGIRPILPRSESQLDQGPTEFKFPTETAPTGLFFVEEKDNVTSQ